MAWAALTGLPVAGISGTLIDRYDVAEPGRGTVRAKTGTLSKVVVINWDVSYSKWRGINFYFYCQRGAKWN